jgi:gamma-glutamyl-gamma-aminobutyrate hydrolase PuuD
MMTLISSKKLTYYSLSDFGGEDSSTSFFDRHGFEQVDMNSADIIVFNGGTDIGSSIYGERSVSYGANEPSKRDKYEIDVFNKYKGSKFFFGICRGAQLLNCLNGGSLWQDVNNHGRDHNMCDIPSGKLIRVTSTHHQMMRPNLKTGIVIGVSSESTRKFAAGEAKQFDPKAIDVKDGDDVEIVWYPLTASLCVQGHPEYVPNGEFAHYSLDLINKYYKEAMHAQAV